MSKKPILTILTGAGMSAESNLSTFRDSDGLWANYKVEEICTPQALRDNPELVIEFYNKRRQEAHDTTPNEGHKLIAQLEKDYDVRVVTQNVDDLHERAGSTNVIHLHGELNKCASVVDPYTPRELPDGRLKMSVNDKDEHGNMLRPFIVFFGEQVPRLDEAIREVQKADIFLIIGTSLNVYPAAGLLYYARPGIPMFLIDPKNVSTPSNVEHITCGASEGMKIFIDKLKNLDLGK